MSDKQSDINDDISTACLQKNKYYFALTNTDDFNRSGG
jgi:hypothetical protein